VVPSPTFLIKNIKVAMPCNGAPSVAQQHLPFYSPTFRFLMRGCRTAAGTPLSAKIILCRFAISCFPWLKLRSRKVRGRQSVFAALRHDVLKRFKGASLYKRERDALIKHIEVGMPYSGRDLSSQAGQQLSAIRPLLTYNFMDVPSSPWDESKIPRRGRGCHCKT